jgi:hypothetical protein
VPAATFWVSVSFCFANSFAFSSLRNVSVAREKARFAGDILFCSNETYQVSWGLTAMGVLAGNEIASSFRSPAATRHRVAWTRSAAAVSRAQIWPLPPPSRRRRTRSKYSEHFAVAVASQAKAPVTIRHHSRMTKPRMNAHSIAQTADVTTRTGRNVRNVATLTPYPWRPFARTIA